VSTVHIVLDTNVVSLIHKGRLPGPLARQLAGSLPLITFVTVGELTKWAEARSWGGPRRDALDRWIDQQAVVYCDDNVARIWGRLSAAADRRGRPRPDNDMWIAACCLAQGAALATLNVKDFGDFADHHGLQIIS
jgi:predicted nucleic acid-binding protein